ncbi:GNAT family N-acetyltransferase [Enterococcus ureilyticus]|uniref:GNAT family N-acetyltransferase n=1 Tax=Enterococcus ureilyticus TaxID=1131292 RepID=A0A1E5HDG5_9ENTE|nr:GNAT family N-acetyltransferase [Enterococcus ureilyticus]MBM7690031.1 ribosomal protein S18 acetylase RimI-like enzyme [Enterococcus ureilyticus]OEG22983.1 GNAT family N-acetyltransferase [Enterococcus ureilyticus]
MVVYLRRAVPDDLSTIIEIITYAQKLLYDQNIPQWQNNDGPNQKLLEYDIKLQRCYVLIVDQAIAGLGVLSSEIEEPYEQIKNGQWQLTYGHYMTIHRVALAPFYQGKGFASLLMNYLITTARLNDFRDIRIDTHPQNTAMQRLIEKVGFSYQGEILLPISNGARFAYQMILT